MECPICGNPMSSQRYRDDVCGAIVTVETYDRCPSGHYTESSSYGSYEITVGDRQWGYAYHDSEETVDRIFAEVDAAVAEMKAFAESHCQ